MYVLQNTISILLFYIAQAFALKKWKETEKYFFNGRKKLKNVFLMAVFINSIKTLQNIFWGEKIFALSICTSYICVQVGRWGPGTVLSAYSTVVVEAGVVVVLVVVVVVTVEEVELY